MSKQLPTNVFETPLWTKGIQYIAGVDEVGRGCFAGPVVAGAVILPKGFANTIGIDDSKRLSAKRREQLAAIIKEQAICYAVAEVSVSVIDSVGIARATQQAFAQAVTDLQQSPEHIFVDAFLIQSFAEQVQTPLIHGDRKSVSIAAASIIAKVYRDALMEQLHETYPVYDFAVNKGYGTLTHRNALARYGLSPLHRTSFHLQKYVNAEK